MASPQRAHAPSGLRFGARALFVRAAQDLLQNFGLAVRFPQPRQLRMPTPKRKSPSFRRGFLGCAGAIRGLEHVVFKAFSLPLVA